MYEYSYRSICEVSTVQAAGGKDGFTCAMLVASVISAAILEG